MFQVGSKVFVFRGWRRNTPLRKVIGSYIYDLSLDDLEALYAWLHSRGMPEVRKGE